MIHGQYYQRRARFTIKKAGPFLTLPKLVSLIHTWHGLLPCLFLQRLPQGLLTHATWGGLKTAHPTWLRGVYLHLLYSLVPQLPIETYTF
jgi:hypothetical protein